MGCGDATGWPIRTVGSSGGARNAGASGGGPSTEGTPGCNGDATPATSPSDGYLTIDVGGTSRAYVLELPSSYDGRTPQPVLFALHGDGANAQDFFGPVYGDVRTGVAGRAILVGPQALSGTGQISWFGSSGGIAQADLDFFDALVAELEANYCVARRRIFAMGHGAGAFFATELGCLRSGVLRGVGPFSGGGPDGTCGGKLAAFIGHNPNDTLLDWATTGWPTVQFWASEDGCSDPGAMPTAAYPGDGTTGNPPPCQGLAGCDANYPVTLCLYDYSDEWDGNTAFPSQWAAKAATDFFLALPPV